MKQGEIVLVPFPFTDLSSVKTRPALIISKKNYDNDLVLLGITSVKSMDSVCIDNDDLTKGSLPLLSYVKCRKVVSLDRKIVRQVVAKLNQNKIDVIVDRFVKQF